MSEEEAFEGFIDSIDFNPETFNEPFEYEELIPNTTSSLKKPIVTREEWGAEPPRETVELTFPVRQVLFAHTKTEECFDKDDCIKIVQQLQKQHMSEGLPDIRYNFIVGSDKNVYEGRGWSARPDKNEKYPDVFNKFIEIAYIGNYEDREPLKEIMVPAWDVLEDGIRDDKLFLRFRVIEDYYQQSSRVEDLVKKYVKPPKS